MTSVIHRSGDRLAFDRPASVSGRRGLAGSGSTLAATGDLLRLDRVLNGGTPFQVG